MIIDVFFISALFHFLYWNQYMLLDFNSFMLLFIFTIFIYQLHNLLWLCMFTAHDKTMYIKCIISIFSKTDISITIGRWCLLLYWLFMYMHLLQWIIKFIEQRNCSIENILSSLTSINLWEWTIPGHKYPYTRLF